MKRAHKKTAADAKGPLTLAIDIGGTGIKSAVLDADHRPMSEFKRLPTPHPATIKAILDTIAELVKQEGPFDRTACGFPGVIKNGVIFTAANLSEECIGVDLAAALEKEFGKPARVANDAARAYLVFNHNGLLERIGKLRTNQPRQRVHATASRLTDDDAQGFSGEVLRKGKGTDKRACCDQRSQHSTTVR